MEQATQIWIQTFPVIYYCYFYQKAFISVAPVTALTEPLANTSEFILIRPLSREGKGGSAVFCPRSNGKFAGEPKIEHRLALTYIVGDLNPCQISNTKKPERLWYQAQVKTLMLRASDNILLFSTQESEPSQRTWVASYQIIGYSFMCFIHGCVYSTPMLSKHRQQ